VSYSTIYSGVLEKFLGGMRERKDAFKNIMEGMTAVFEKGFPKRLPVGPDACFCKE